MEYLLTNERESGSREAIEGLLCSNLEHILGKLEGLAIILLLLSYVNCLVSTTKEFLIDTNQRHPTPFFEMKNVG
jgi:hypothetical protein